VCSECCRSKIVKQAFYSYCMECGSTVNFDTGKVLVKSSMLMNREKQSEVIK